MKHVTPILIVLLFISSSFVGMGNQVREMESDKEIAEQETSNLKFLPIFSYENCSRKLQKYEEYLANEHFTVAEDNTYTVGGALETYIVQDPLGPIDSAWPMHCHDLHHTGRSPYSTADNPYDEIWRFETDGWLEDTPTIDSDGTIYFGGSYGGLTRYLFAINPDGTEKWKYKTDGLILGSSPAIADDDTIYICSWDHYLHAVNPNGTQKWQFCAHNDIHSSPAIGEDGTIYFGTMLLDNRIYAVNPNGTEKWHYKTGDAITSDPAIGDDGTIYIGSQDSYLYAMNPNGTLKWRYKTGDPVRGPPSIADDGTIYIGSVDKHLHAVFPNGTMKWKHYVGDEIATNPSIAEDGTIYGGGKRLWAINPNGTRKWTFNLGSQRDITASSPAISADGMIYFGTNIGDSSGGEIIAVNPDGTERWRKKIAGKWVDSSPSIGEDGTVYIGSADTMDRGFLHAFNRADLSADADGPYYNLINEPVQFNGTSIGGYRPYSWHWDFGDGNTSAERNPMHTYTISGNYTVTLTVTDNISKSTEDTTFAWIQESNDPPEKPTIIGETNGKIKTEYQYQFMSLDPEGLHIWYFIDWRDGSDTGWIGPYQSGEEIILNHQWSEKGDFNIRCKAKDPYGDESEWGELRVTMPHTFWWLDDLLDRFPLLQRLLEMLI